MGFLLPRHTFSSKLTVSKDTIDLTVLGDGESGETLFDLKTGELKLLKSRSGLNRGTRPEI